MLFPVTIQNGDKIEFIVKGDSKQLTTRETRMKTSISSEALTQYGAEKIAFPQKPDIRTDEH